MVTFVPRLWKIRCVFGSAFFESWAQLKIYQCSRPCRPWIFTRNATSFLFWAQWNVLWRKSNYCIHWVFRNFYDIHLNLNCIHLNLNCIHLNLNCIHLKLNCIHLKLNCIHRIWIAFISIWIAFICIWIAFIWIWIAFIWIWIAFIWIDIASFESELH